MHVKARVRATQTDLLAQICSPEQNMDHFSLQDRYVSLHELANSTCPGNPSTFRLFLAEDAEKGETLWGKAGRGCRFMQMNHVPPSLNPSSEWLCRRCHSKCQCCGMWETRVSSRPLHSGCIHIAWRYNSLPSLGLSVRTRHLSIWFHFFHICVYGMNSARTTAFPKVSKAIFILTINCWNGNTDTAVPISFCRDIIGEKTSTLSIWFYFLFPESWKMNDFHFNLH